MSELEEKVMQAEILKKQAEAASAQLELVMKTLIEMTTTREVLKEISGLAKGTETLVPLGSGAYLKAALSDNSRVLVGLGAETVVEKTIPEAAGLLDEQIIKVEEAREKLVETVEQINATLRILVPDLEFSIAAAEKEGRGGPGFVRIP